MNFKTISRALGIGCLLSVAHAANPFLPSYEYIPDGEPRVFGDRLYLYGSHDKAGSDRFCDYILKVWSAPLNDLNTWTDHGIMLSTRDVDGHKRDYIHSDYEFYAPACVEVNGKYYYFAQVVGAPCVVAVSDTPAGPFKVISKIKAPAGAPNDFGGWGQYFDPGVLVDDDGKVYLYWGGGSSHMAQLDPKTMVDILPTPTGRISSRKKLPIISRKASPRTKSTGYTISSMRRAKTRLMRPASPRTAHLNIAESS